ncbi:MAG: methyltransferase domain-containing protein [Rhodospirillaceae bacterium]|nr:methyltransferase domain-containing protein [Rhodospirillaceae bacterium]
MSSGNLTADRRFAYAQMLRKDGDAVAAADLLAQTLELTPHWAEAQFTLAETLAEADRKDEALAAYNAYLALDPADSMGAAVKLALLGANSGDALPEAYVRRLFDDYAARFDTALVGKLKYRGPQILRAAIDQAQPYGMFSRAYDLGCGTGLMGAALRERVQWLGGVDLSPAMIKEAECKGIYDELAVGDMLNALHDIESCDLIVAADVLTYVGDLAPIFETVRTKLDGFFAFTIQKKDGDGFALGAEHRFSHSRDYITALAYQKGFEILLLQDAVTRQEKGVDVPGLVAVLS